MTKHQNVLLRVTSLSKAYNSPTGALSILSDMDLDLYRGEFLAVVGESGVGKSTLLQILGTLDMPDSGEAYFEGQSIFNLTQSECAQFRNENIGFVYQAHHLIPELSAVENVMLPLLVGGVNKHEAEKKSIQLLSKLGLDKRLGHIPARLSGGEAQRVAVARALVGKPSLLLVDEPTGNLDEATAQSVFKSMQELCKEEGTAVIMVTHSMALAAQVDRAVCLRQGELTDA